MKPADLRRIVMTLVIVACAGVPLYHALGYDTDDIVSVDINAETNLVCQSQRVQDGLNRVVQGYLRQLVRDTINEFKSLVTTYAFQILICQVVNFDKTVGLFGSSVTFKGPNCNIDLGGAVSSAIKRQAIDKIKNDFAARCIADGARKKVGNDIRQITRENGPDGGPAFVQDWTALYVDEDQRGIYRFNAILVNTHICPYFRDAVYEYFGVPQSYINDPPALTGLGLRVDGTESFPQKGQCTLPDDFTLEALDANFLESGGYDALFAVMFPPNNFDGFVRMAEEELARQRFIAVETAVNEAVAGGGFRGVYGDASQSCLNRGPDGKCLALGPVQQPAGGIRDANAAAVQGEIDWINNSQEMNQLMGDVRSRLASMVLNINADPLDYIVGPDQSSQTYQDIGAGTRPPEDVVLPNDPDSGGQGNPPGTTSSCGSTTDPTCTNNNPTMCFCARDCTAFTYIADLFGLATRAACQQFPENVDDPESCATVIPGRELNFLAAICQTTIGEQITQCHTKAGTNNEIVGDFGGVTLSIKVISPSNAILIPGELVAACKPGAQ